MMIISLESVHHVHRTLWRWWWWWSLSPSFCAISSLFSSSLQQWDPCLQHSRQSTDCSLSTFQRSRDSHNNLIQELLLFGPDGSLFWKHWKTQQETVRGFSFFSLPPKAIPRSYHLHHLHDLFLAFYCIISSWSSSALFFLLLCVVSKCVL